MKQEVLKCLKMACPTVDFEGDSLLVDDGVLDSLAIITIISALMETFSVNIDADDIVADNFNTVDNITKMIERKR